MRKKAQLRSLRWPALACLLTLVAVPPLDSRGRGRYQEAAKFDLRDFLRKAAAYCEKLEKANLNFVCEEEIDDRVDPLLDVRASPGAPAGGDMVGEKRPPTPLLWRVRETKRTFLYDYQCIRSNGQVQESRTLLEKNGEKRNEPQAKLETSTFVYANVLQGPVGVFAARFQNTYDYRLGGTDTVGDRPVVIIEAVPKPGAPELKNLYGEAWVDAETADILRVEWSEKRVGHFDIFEERGKAFKREPRITIRSEFRTEKNGIRFPSSLDIEEAYLNERGRAFVRSTTRVTYKNFRFFTVEVEVKEEERPASFFEAAPIGFSGSSAVGSRAGHSAIPGGRPRRGAVELFSDSRRPCPAAGG